jgi:hypothetical protein
MKPILITSPAALAEPAPAIPRDVVIAQMIAFDLKTIVFSIFIVIGLLCCNYVVFALTNSVMLLSMMASSNPQRKVLMAFICGK